MWKKGLLLILVFIVLAGCSGQQAITKPVEKPTPTPVETPVPDAEISFKQSFTATVKNNDSLRQMQQMLDQNINGAIATDASGLTNKLFKVTIGKIEYTLYENGIQKGDKSYHLIKKDSQYLEQFIFNALQTGPSIQLTGTTGELLLGDHEQTYSFDESQIKSLNEQIQKGKYLHAFEGYYRNIIYPFVQVQVDHDLLLTFMKKDVVYVSVGGNYDIGAFQLPNEELFDQIQAKYPQSFARTGIFKYQAAIFIASEYAKPIVHDNTNFELDSIMRVLLGSKKVTKPKVLPEYPFIIESKSSHKDRILIYKNGYWSQNGEYFYKEGVYAEMTSACS